jgi:hypothetical protein
MKKSLIEGIVTKQTGNEITIEIASEKQFDQFEEIEIRSKKETYLDALRGLYWVLLQWVIDNEIQYKLPNSNGFRRGEPKKLAKDKLYYYVRFMTGWVEIGYDKDGNQTIQAKSTDHKNMNQDEFDDHYNKVYTLIASYADMTEFEVQHQAAKEALGKFN